MEMLSPKGNAALFCFMCELTSEEAIHAGKVLIRSPNPPKNNQNGAICADCIKNAHSIVIQNELSSERPTTDTAPQAKNGMLTPASVYSRLNESVIGQDVAKGTIAIAISNHFYRSRDKSLEKTNVMIIGPTGTGKTELARTTAKILNVPFVIADATSFTAHGYVGDDVETVLVKLLKAAKMNLNLAQRGVVFIDEIDKLATRESNALVGTLAVQQALLKMLEGSIVTIPRNLLMPKSEISGQEQGISFDTSKVLFICAGAFSDLDCSTLESKRKQMGLGADLSAKNQLSIDYAAYNHKDIISIGLIPEFVGRFHVLVSTSPLTVESLRQILTEPENSITRQYQKLFVKYNIALQYSDNFLNEVAQEAFVSGLGARGLRSIMEKRLAPVFFEIVIPDQVETKKKIVIL